MTAPRNGRRDGMREPNRRVLDSSQREMVGRVSHHFACKNITTKATCIFFFKVGPPKAK